MGTEAEQIYKTLYFKKKEDEKNFDVILSKFEAYFMAKRNVIYERPKFYLRTQRDGEPIEKFVRGLYELAENCDFRKTTR